MISLIGNGSLLSGKHLLWPILFAYAHSNLEIRLVIRYYNISIISVHFSCNLCFASVTILVGYYLNDLACADVSGAHFVAFHKQVNILDEAALLIKESDLNDNKSSESENGQKRAIFSFFQSLPDLVLHPSPATREKAIVNMKQQCDCLNYCWENRKGKIW